MTLSASSILIHYRNPAMSVQTILHILSTLIATSSMPVAVCVFVPTHLREVGGGERGTIYSNGFSQFWPIDINIVESCEWYH